MTVEEKRRRIAEFEAKRGYPWFHNIDLGDGIITPGAQNSHATLRRVEIPMDLAGMTVLDIGCNDGFYSLECEKRGAKVTAIDTFSETAEFVVDLLGSGVEVLHGDFQLWETDRTFDLVLFMGVLYHLRHPFMGIEKVRSLCHGDLILESHCTDMGGTTPAMQMYPKAELNNDPSNWWGPNPACIYAMLNDVGFTDIRVRGREGSRIVYHARVEQ